MDATVSDITLTVEAADKVASLLAEEGNPNLNLRAYVIGGGCSGYQYGFTFDEEIKDDDFIIEQRRSDGNGSIKLLVDFISHQYLSNAKIDFKKGIGGEQFVISNPNAKTTCGCGSSFSMDDEE